MTDLITVKKIIYQKRLMIDNLQALRAEFFTISKLNWRIGTLGRNKVRRIVTLGPKMELEDLKKLLILIKILFNNLKWK